VAQQYPLIPGFGVHCFRTSTNSLMCIVMWRFTRLGSLVGRAAGYTTRGIQNRAALTISDTSNNEYGASVHRSWLYGE
jgi:hypothetical protein